MLCYVFKVRQTKYTSKKDNKAKSGYNVGLIALEGAKFAMETFIDSKDDVFDKSVGDLSKVFKTGFWDIDIDEYVSFQNDRGSVYQKKIIKICGHRTLDDAKEYLV